MPRLSLSLDIFISPAFFPDDISIPGIEEWPLSGIAALFVPPLITATAIFIILFTAHTLAGTPEIALPADRQEQAATCYAAKMAVFSADMQHAPHQSGA